MAIRAVAFDIGGVLERVDAPETWLRPWQIRLGMGEAEFQAAIALVDPDDLAATGGLSEPEYRQRYADSLGLSDAQADAFIAEMWDWYCGELDTELTAYAAGLRPQYLTAILSNSADGARREEQARYHFADLFDTIIYSHEVGLAKPDPRIYVLLCDRLRVTPAELVFIDDTPERVDAACQLGISGVLHRSTPQSIKEISSLIAA